MTDSNNGYARGKGTIQERPASGESKGHDAKDSAIENTEFA